MRGETRLNFYAGIVEREGVTLVFYLDEHPKVTVMHQGIASSPSAALRVGFKRSRPTADSGSREEFCRRATLAAENGLQVLPSDHLRFEEVLEARGVLFDPRSHGWSNSLNQGLRDVTWHTRPLPCPPGGASRPWN